MVTNLNLLYAKKNLVKLVERWNICLNITCLNNQSIASLKNPKIEVDANVQK